MNKLCVDKNNLTYLKKILHQLILYSVKFETFNKKEKEKKILKDGHLKFKKTVLATAAR